MSCYNWCCWLNVVTKRIEIVYFVNKIVCQFPIQMRTARTSPYLESGILCKWPNPLSGQLSPSCWYQPTAKTSILKINPLITDMDWIWFEIWFETRMIYIVIEETNIIYVFPSCKCRPSISFWARLPIFSARIISNWMVLILIRICRLF